MEDRIPAPAILEYLPYRHRDGTSERDDINYPAFAIAGYAGVRVDMAGNGESDGLMTDEYLEDELAIGQEIIEWIAAQPWCSGAVGMIGISWGGFNGLQIAMRDVPALRAVVTVCSTHDRYRQETHYMGGCVLNDNFNWGAQMTGLTCRPPDPQVRSDWREMWLNRMQRLPHFAADWLRHQRHGAYWKHGSVCEDWSAIDCAVLTIGGWADSYSDTPATLLQYLSSPVKALVGPWEHRYPNIAANGPQADFVGEVIRWFDRWLKNDNNGVEDLPNYRVYMQEHNMPPSPEWGMQRGRWVSEQNMPLTSLPLMFYLTSSGLSLTMSAVADEVTISSPQNIGVTAGNYCPGMRVNGELPADQRLDDEKSMCFDSEVLTNAVDILGAPIVEIELSVDQPQALLALRLCDVTADGSSQRVSFMVFNLTHRNSHERPVDLQPGQRYRLSIPLRHCAHRFASGHRIRLALSTSYWPIIWPSATNAAVNLQLQNCCMHLPQRQSATKEASHIVPAEPPSLPKSAYEYLRVASNKSEVIVHDDGSHELVLTDDMGEKRNPHHGMEIGITATQKFTIHPDNPLSAKAETIWEYTYRRGDWNTRVESAHAMTCDAHSFVLYRKVTAYEGGGQVFEKIWRDVIARDSC